MEVWDGDVHIGIKSMWVKAVGLTCQGVSAAGEEKGSEDGALSTLTLRAGGDTEKIKEGRKPKWGKFGRCQTRLVTPMRCGHWF